MKIKAIIKRPDEEFGHVCYVSNTLENLQRIVGGYIEAIPLTDNMVVICNEEGKLRGFESNFHIPWAVVVGTVLVVGYDGDKFDDIPIRFDLWKKLLKEWGN